MTTSVIDTSDHHRILTRPKLNVTRYPSTSTTTVTYRRLHKIDYHKLINNLHSTPLTLLTLTDLPDSYHRLPVTRHSRTNRQQTNNSSRTKPSSWITSHILNLKSAADFNI